MVERTTGTEFVGPPMKWITDEDPTPEQRMAIIEASGVLQFWDGEEEDWRTDG